MLTLLLSGSRGCQRGNLQNSRAVSVSLWLPESLHLAAMICICMKSVSCTLLQRRYCYASQSIVKAYSQNMSLYAPVCALNDFTLFAHQSLLKSILSDNVLYFSVMISILTTLLLHVKCVLEKKWAKCLNFFFNLPQTKRKTLLTGIVYEGVSDRLDTSTIIWKTFQYLNSGNMTTFPP